ncbi:MAG: hypothetical protein KIH62_005115 [Candidatus Kerfeldbacteria bacterium]|nr:hypothetical protein [Candidatus Kerfeldbacteria bacterium]
MLDKGELTTLERKLFSRLRSPIAIQNFLDSIPTNWEKNGETCMSPRMSLRAKKMHCMEGALCAAAALWFNGEKPLVMDLRADGDDDHVVALYTRNGYWGAISKTNHATLRFRDPIYKTLRELALSYFHEYFLNTTGKKVLRKYSARPFDLSRFGNYWITSKENLFEIPEAIDDARHISVVPLKNLRLLRLADSMERKAGNLIEWNKEDPRT